MPKILHQKVKFNASPETLYSYYIDPKKHSKITNSAVKISKKPGSSFSAFKGYVKGKTLQLIPNKLILQFWRGSDWKKSELDSILILKFNKSGKKGEIELLHLNVPDKYSKEIDKGWHDHYWKPLKKLLSK